MRERKLYEVPRFLTTEEVAEFANLTVRTVKYRGTRRGWAYGIGRDGVRYWDVSTLTLEMPEVLFDGFLRHDAAIIPLCDLAQAEAECFIDAISQIRTNTEYVPYYADAVLLCRTLEILQDSINFMPSLYMPYACVALHFQTGIPVETLESVAQGGIFETPLFMLSRTFWMPLLTEYTRAMFHQGVQRVENVHMHSQKPRIKKALRQLKPAIAAMQ